MLRKIKNTNAGGLGTYIGSGAGDEKEHIVFGGGAVTDIDDKKLAEACKDPIVKGWFESGDLVDQTVPEVAKAAPAVEAKAAK